MQLCDTEMWTHKEQSFQKQVKKNLHIKKLQVSSLVFCGFIHANLKDHVMSSCISAHVFF